MHYGPTIRRLREAKRWTLAELAHHCDMDAGNLSRVGTGQQELPLKKLKAVAEALETSPAMLFVLAEGADEDIPVDAMKIATVYYFAGPDDKAKMKALGVEIMEKINKKIQTLME